MAKTYLWKASTRFQSPTDLSYGVSPADQSDWQTGTPGTPGGGTWEYWYRDATVEVGGAYTDANSSRVVVSLSETWSATIDSRNRLSVTINTTLNSVRRDDLRGQNVDTYGRYIRIYRSEGETPLLDLTDTNMTSAHTIYQGPLVLDQFSFTLEPGQNLERSSLYLHNQTIGGTSYDDIWFGVQFQNNLPRDYRPGALLSGGVWLSHDRDGGECHVFNGSKFVEMRTVDGPTGMGNPPSVYYGSKWYNMNKTGRL